LLLQRFQRGRRLSSTRSTGRLLRPLLAPWYRLVADGERLLLEHGRSVVCFEGAAVRSLLPSLLPLLDGRHTVDEVHAATGAAARPAIEQALELLEANGLLVEGPPAVGGAANMLAAAWGVAPAAVEQRFREARVVVIGEAMAAGEIAELLLVTGVGAVERATWDDDSGRPDLTVVAPAPAETPELVPWNTRALAAGLRWLPVRPFDGLIVSVGPLVVPGESACFQCLLLRTAAHLEYGGDVARLEAVPIAAPSSSALETLTAGLVAHIAAGCLAGPDLPLPSVLYVLETRPSLALGSHTVLRVPRCPACSHVERIAPPLPWHAAVLPAQGLA
jgi:bacteriocin biosynthesis cyclodehydratase domain-containing protein